MYSAVEQRPREPRSKPGDNPREGKFEKERLRERMNVRYRDEQGGPETGLSHHSRCRSERRGFGGGPNPSLSLVRAGKSRAWHQPLHSGAASPPWAAEGLQAEP